MSKKQISTYVDTLIAEIILSDPSMIKTAQGFSASDTTSGISNFFSERLSGSSNLADKAVNFLSFIAPGAIFMTLHSFGSPWIGALLAMAATVFKVPIKNILADIYLSIKDLISGGKKTNPQAVDAAVTKAVEKHSGTESSENLEGLFSLNRSIRSAKLVKIALTAYQNNQIKVGQKAPVSKWTFLGVLSSFLKWVFKTSLISAGLMLAGSILPKYNAEQDTDTPVSDKITKQKYEKTSPSSPAVPSIYNTVSENTMFEVSPSYVDSPKNIGNIPWQESNYNSTEYGIEDMLLDFSKEVYPELQGKENIIKSSESFQDLVADIYNFNRVHEDSRILFIPDNYHTKKELVNVFIKDVENIISNESDLDVHSTEYTKNSIPIKKNKSAITTEPIATKESETYPIVISEKWKNRMKPSHHQLMSKLNPTEQKKVEEYLDNLSIFELAKINSMSESEQLELFKQEAKKFLGEAEFNRRFG